MKHLLNNLSEEEKNSIREQHTGGMNLMIENFKKLISSKSGDVKPLVNEQRIDPNVRDNTNVSNNVKPIGQITQQKKVTPESPYKKREDPVRRDMVGLIKNLKSEVHPWDGYVSTDDLLRIYNRLKPYVGKNAMPGAVPEYKEMDYVDQQPIAALHYFDRMWPQTLFNEYGMGGLWRFTQEIEKIGDNDLSGNPEKSSNGKYTAAQVKKMILDLMNKEILRNLPRV